MRHPYPFFRKLGETIEQARERADNESAERARAAGLADLICNHCDRIKAACYKDSKTCESRQEKRRGYPRFPQKV